MSVGVMEIEYCEFQFDRKKLVLYAAMEKRVDFRDYVTVIHNLVQKQLGFYVRLFIQRRFKGIGVLDDKKQKAVKPQKRS